MFYVKKKMKKIVCMPNIIKGLNLKEISNKKIAYKKNETRQ